jgi:hypothetical protein
LHFSRSALLLSLAGCDVVDDLGRNANKGNKPIYIDNDTNSASYSTNQIRHVLKLISELILNFCAMILAITCPKYAACQTRFDQKALWSPNGCRDLAQQISDIVGYASMSHSDSAQPRWLPTLLPELQHVIGQQSL